MTGSSEGRDPIDRLADSVVGRLRAGELPNAAEYQTRYPELASQVGVLLPALIELEQNASVDRAEMSRSFATGDAPRQLGEYTIVREIGRGGMGVVYEAVQESLGRHVALKVFQSSSLSGAHLERFRREAKAAGRLHHTNIVPVYGVGEQAGVHYYVMQFIRGQSVNLIIDELGRLRCQQVASAVVRRDSLEAHVPRRDDAIPGNAYSSGATAPTELSSSAAGAAFYRSVARVGLQVAEALDYAHSHGVLHRDIKPSNLLLDGHGTVWITDFGLAKSEGSNDLTETGDVVGTLHYMAPERLDGRSDRRSDIYGLGATLYELVALRPPYKAAARAKLIQNILHAPAAPLRRYDNAVPRDLETIIVKALAKEPGERYADARQMADDLRLFLSDRSIRSRRTTAVERIWRWRRRNPELAAITAALILVFALGFAGVTWKWRDAERARRSEHTAREEADRRAEEIQQGHLRLQEASTLVEIGTQFSERRGWDDADAAYSKAVALRPELDAGWEKRGELYFRLGLFDLAAADFLRAFELHEPINHRQWRRLALLRLHVGDVEGYRVVADRMAKRFRRTVHGEAAIDLVRTCTLADNPNGEPAEWAGLAERMTSGYVHHDVMAYVAGAANYRAGEYRQAIERCRRAASGSVASDQSLPIQAMAYHGLGNAVSAAQALDGAVRVRDQWLDRIHSSVNGSWIIDQGATGQWPIDQVEWLEFDLYVRQAADLLGAPLPEDARLNVQRARAFAGLRRREAADEEYRQALRIQPHDHRLAGEAHRNRGFLRMRAGQFREASAEFDLAMGPDRSDYDLWYYIAVNQCASGDVSAYRKTCSSMFDRFGKETDRRTILTLVLTCTLRPDAISDVTELQGAVQDLGRWWVDNERILVALYYRLARYEDSLQSLRRLSETAVPYPGTLFFAAMANHRLGRQGEARRLLDEGVAAMTVATDAPALRTLANGLDPRDGATKLSERVLREEAERLIAGRP